MSGTVRDERRGSDQRRSGGPSRVRDEERAGGDGQRSASRTPGPAAVEERLRRRDRALGWTLFGLLLLGMAVLAGLTLIALPLMVIAFPLTLGAIAGILLIGWWRRRRTG